MANAESRGPRFGDQGKVLRTLITGASGDIGRSLVTVFKSHGHKVFATDKVPRPEDLEADHYAELDLTTFTKASPEERRKIVSVLLAGEESLGLNALINNAAIQVCAPTEELDLAGWERTLSVNVLAPFFLVQSLLPNLEKASGAVVNISSIHARLTKPEFVAYATTKSAMSGLTRALAVDLANRVRVNAVEPSAVDTRMLKASFEDSDSNLSDLASHHPQLRIAAPKEVASLVYAIASDEFRFLHGACVDISGAISARLHDPA